MWKSEDGKRASEYIFMREKKLDYEHALENHFRLCLKIMYWEY